MKLLFDFQFIGISPEDQLMGNGYINGGFFIFFGVYSPETLKKHKKIIQEIHTHLQQEKLSLLDAVTKIHNDLHLVYFTVGYVDDENTLHVGNKGGGLVWMKRAGKAGQILSAEGTMKGKIQEGDVLLVATEDFNRQLDCSSIKNILITYEDKQSIVANIHHYLHTLSQSSGTLLFLQTLPIHSRRLPAILSAAKFKSFIEKGKRWIVQDAHPLQADLPQLKTKRVLLTVASVLIILLVASVFLNISHTQNEKVLERLNGTLTLVTHQYDEASTLIDLNPIRARTLLSDSKLTLGQVMKEFSKDSNEYKQLSEWVNKVAEKEVEAYKIYKMTQVPVFFDLTLIKSGGEGKKIAGYEQTKTILDTKNKVIYSLVTTTKESEIIAGSDIVRDATMLTIHGKRVYLINSDGVVGIDVNSKQSQKLISHDGEWGEIVDIAAFGGNLYLLDKTNNRVWKYIATDEGFSSRTSYLNSDVHADFSSAFRLVVDGSVWVLAKPADIMKFSKGLGETFEFKGFAERIDDLGGLSTSDIDKNVYMLDMNGSRILVFDKDGVYQSQYQWDELKGAEDIFASESEKKIFILIGSKIYAIDIR